MKQGNKELRFEYGFLALRPNIVAAVGNCKLALILARILFLAEGARDAELRMAEEKRRAAAHLDGENLPEPAHGWITKSADAINDEAMLDANRKTIMGYMKKLEDLGFIYCRTVKNPENKYDRRNQYRVNYIALNAAMQEHGMHLEEYAFMFETPATGESNQNKKSICETHTAGRAHEENMPSANEEKSDVPMSENVTHIINNIS